MTGKKIMLGMLTLGSLDIRMASFLYQLLKSSKHDITIQHTARMDISNGRNEILGIFLNSGNDYLIFLDDDNPPEDINFIDKLLSHKKDIVSGIVPSRKPDGSGRHRVCVFSEAKYDSGQHQYMQYVNVPEGDDLFEIANCGMGCVLITRRVAQSMVDRYPMPCCSGFYWYYKIGGGFIREDEMDIYSLKEGTPRFRRYMGEDLIFFERARSLGFKIFADKSVRCTHFGDINIISINENIIGANKGKSLFCVN